MSNLKNLRQQKGFTQAYVASKLGVTRQAYNHYETGRRTPPSKALLKLASLYDCSVDHLMNFSPSVYADVGTLNPVKILGSVRAGFEHAAYQDYEGYEMLEVDDPDEYFLLHVEGDSMEPHIYEGDMALVHQQQTVDTGDIAVVLVDGEDGTIKRFLRSGGDILLEPFNQSYETRVFSGAQKARLSILGKVVRTYRSW